MDFITVMAWIFGVSSTLVLALRILAAATYSDIQEAMDMMKGVRRSFPILWPSVVAVVCWAWIITGQA